MIIFYVIFILPVMAVLSALIYLPFYLVNKKKYGKRPFVRHLCIYALIGVIASVLYATIFWGGFRFVEGFRMLNLVPFIWVKETYAMGFANMIKQLVINTIMLVPFGFFLPIVFEKMRKCWKTVLVTAVFIFCIEFTQYFIGRSADVDDLIMNSFGALIGYVVFWLCNKGFGKKKFWKDAMNQE